MDIVHSIVVQNATSDVFQQLREFVGKKTAKETTLGTRFSEAFHYLGWKRNFQFEITGLIPNREIKAKTTDNNLSMEGTFELIPEQNGIRIFWKVRMQPKGTSKMFAQQIKNSMSKQLERKLEQLKEKLDFNFINMNGLSLTGQSDRHWL